MEIPRQPGQRDARYMHLFCGEVDIPAETAPELPLGAPTARETHGVRLDRLEDVVVELRKEIDEIKAMLD